MPARLPRWTAPAALVVAALAAHSVWPGTAPWDLSAARREMRAAAETGARLDADIDAVGRQTAVRRAISADLAAGRISLAEAAARLLAAGVVEGEDRAAGLAVADALHHVPPRDRDAAAGRWESERRRAAGAVAHR